MNTIIELISDIKNPNEVIQAVKIFEKQNQKLTSITLIGPEKLMATIKDEKTVKTFFSDDEDKNLEIAFSHINDKDTNFIFFSDYTKVISEAIKNKVPFINASKTIFAIDKFSLPEMGQFVYFVNTLNTNKETKTTFKEINMLSQNYLTKHSKGKTKTFKFLTTFENDEKIEELTSVFKEDKAYLGLITPTDLVNPECDYILSKSEINATFFDGFKFAFTVSDALYKKETSLNFLTKIGNSLTKSARKTIDLRFDKKTRSYGTVLIGFKSPFILTSKDAKLNSVLAALNTSKY